ncbi:glutamyl-tRNA amidotransferase [Vibrio kasasachensis]|uniref:amidase family protein n=1 Tax=Vibrio kasasachensis TaxID=2910248 RepID=UPI003D0B73F8
MTQNTYSFASSGAFVETFTLKPYQKGPLDGLTFAVKDNIDIGGYKTSYGSIPWRSAHKAPVYNALCVEQLLGNGATCLGKTVADEYTYSLDGESYFFGTPINPKAPERVPGGSSSGSASAVACGLVDFSIGTDSAGSIRVPASLCGIWGMRPTLHRISEAGVLPFMPSVSTVGAFSNDINILENVMRTMLRSEEVQSEEIINIYLLEDAFSISDAEVNDAIRNKISPLFEIPGIAITSINLSDIVGEGIDLNVTNSQALRVLQTAEFVSTVGNWIEAFSPEKGPSFSAAYENIQSFDRTELNNALLLCENVFKKISHFMKKGDLFIFPTTPTIAPLKGSLNNLDSVLDFYDRTMAITSFAGIGGLPEISIPLATINGSPIGLSVAAGRYQDEFLLSSVKKLFP